MTAAPQREYATYALIADLQSLTDHFDAPEQVRAVRVAQLDGVARRPRTRDHDMPTTGRSMTRAANERTVRRRQMTHPINSTTPTKIGGRHSQMLLADGCAFCQNPKTV